MIDSDLNPLPPDLEALLDSERRVSAPGPDPEVRSRVRSRVALTLGLAGLGSSAAAAAAPATAPAAAVPTTTPWLGSSALLKLGAGVLGGLVLATGTYLALRTERMEVPPPATSSPGPGAPVAPPLPREMPPAAAPASAPVGPAGPVAALPIGIGKGGGDPAAPSPGLAPRHRSVSPTSDALAAERALLDRARGALMRGDMDQTLKLTSHHARQFPRGQLAEERDALAIRALAQKGELGAARGRAVQFRARYPHSIFLPALATALSSPQ